MKTILSIILITSCMSAISAQTNYPTLGKVVKLDPALDALIAPDAKIEVLSSGYKWSEGPVWVKNGKYLLFSDVPANTIYRWQEGNRAATSFLKPSGYTGLGEYSDEPGSNGLIINQKGELVACEHGDRRISALPLTVGGKRTLADNFQGKRFNSPNDVVQHSSGAYYFTDPPYGLMKKENDPTRETDLFGVYRIGTDGKVSLVVSDLQRPNGLAFSPDEKILYVAQSDPSRAVIMAYPVNADGSVGLGKVFYDATPAVKEGKLKGLPDGLKIDKKGNIFSTGPGGVLVITSAGKLLGRIDTNEPTANCAWGDDGSTLYLTSNMHICRIKTLTTGVGF
ncbi:SMP-30/gluconolactonase/LRE family protein [Arcicella sp. LKC2W]|uniref:SMP-30/gluconolactonase/LRE family protein n=1 Tax=Arcicella sp. LKC2W TaxID=2984198 RepID=UPI002B21408D|nr:SMP-30/gluconolactonase/LRE family protein [Arcicella sp. LKC2W]MEA5458247.1 SMP-30/gluconolactonase/LRE family protein [Arcicella sp. LKC2W]